MTKPQEQFEIETLKLIKIDWIIFTPLLNVTTMIPLN